MAAGKPAIAVSAPTHRIAVVSAQAAGLQPVFPDASARSAQLFVERR